MSDSVFNPAVLAIVVVAGLLVFICQRKKAIIPFFFASLLVPTDQVVVLGGAHFPMLRVLVLFAIVWILKEKASSNRPLFSGGMNKIDIAVILLTVFVAINSVLLFQESGAVINQLGNLFTVFGVYFFLRFLIREEEDVVRAIRTLAYVAACVAMIMTYEIVTKHNPYALLGGARASAYAHLIPRGERVRAQAGFAHSLLAGTFGAVLMPLFVALWWKSKEHRRIAGLGVASATVITLAANSSTPILAYAAGVLALCLWPIRGWMRVIRWGVVMTIVFLQVVLKNPVWHLIARIDISGGSSGYHRYMLIDQCIRHFWDWWLIGVKDTSVWGWDMWDTANQYVALCDGSGLLPFVLFIAVIVYAFKYLGKARRRAKKDRATALFMWALAASLFANVIAFFGISYYDQTIVAWYSLLAMISAAAASQKSNSTDARTRVPADEISPVLEREEQMVQ